MVLEASLAARSEQLAAHYAQPEVKLLAARMTAKLISDGYGLLESRPLPAGMLAGHAIAQAEAYPVLVIASKWGVDVRAAELVATLPAGLSFHQAQGRRPYPLVGNDVVLIQRDLIVSWADMLAEFAPASLVLMEGALSSRRGKRFGVLHRLASGLPTDGLLIGHYSARALNLADEFGELAQIPYI